MKRLPKLSKSALALNPQLAPKRKRARKPAIPKQPIPPSTLQSFTVTVPLPDSRLLPNRAKSLHWAVKAHLVKRLRSTAALLCRQALGSATAPNWAKAIEQTEWFHAKQHPDPDAGTSAAKAAYDGLTTARIIEDDRHLRHHPIIFIKSGQPRLRITVTPE